MDVEPVVRALALIGERLEDPHQKLGVPCRQEDIDGERGGGFAVELAHEGALRDAAIQQAVASEIEQCPAHGGLRDVEKLDELGLGEEFLAVHALLVNDDAQRAPELRMEGHVPIGIQDETVQNMDGRRLRDGGSGGLGIDY